MTAIKIDAKLAGNAQLALDAHTARLYANPGIRIVGVVELAHVERTQPAPDEDKEASVKLAIKHLEVGRDDQEDVLRKAMRALYLHRSARGTLTEDGDIQLSDRTLELTAGLLGAVESARLRSVLSHWSTYARQATTGQLTLSQMREELATIADGLAAGLGTTGEDDDV